MRVIDTPLLWDNRMQAKKTRSVFYLVPRTILLGAIIAAGVVAIVSFSTGKKTSSHVAQIPKPTVSAAVPAGHVAGKSIGLETFLPEGDNPSSFLVNKILATPPPLPTANCVIDACVALTFDDGPNPESTPVILDALKQGQAQATFFEIGRLVPGNEIYLKRMHDQGEEIGNHSWAHPDLTKISDEFINQQIQLTQTAITAAGVPIPTLFRPPYGSINTRVLRQIQLPVILWNVDPKDWAQKDPGSVVKLVEEQIKPGAIIVMHDKKITAEAVGKILQDLKGKYRFVTVSQLLNLTPTSQGVYVGR